MRASVSRILIGVVFVAFLVMALLPVLAPRPLAVDLHRVTRGPMQVSVSEQGKTRVKDLYTVSASISGRMQRVDLDAGDPVVAGRTVLTRIQAPQPRFHDLREATEMQARVASAEAQRDLAAADVERAGAELAFAEAELKRNRDLANRGVASARTLEAAELDVRVKRAALVVARNNLAAKIAEVAVAKATLIAPPGSNETGPITRSDGRGNSRATRGGGFSRRSTGQPDPGADQRFPVAQDQGERNHGDRWRATVRARRPDPTGGARRNAVRGCGQGISRAPPHRSGNGAATRCCRVWCAGWSLMVSPRFPHWG